MTYAFYDAWSYAIEPWRTALAFGQAMLTHPLSPTSSLPAARLGGAALEMVERGTRRYAKPNFDLGVPEEIERLTPFCRLITFGEPDDTTRPRLLVVAPLSGHHATLLRGTVAGLLDHFRVTITDWTDASAVPLAAGPFGLDDYVATCLKAFRHLGPDLHVMAVCQPCVPVLAAIAHMEAHQDPMTPASATLIGGPVDTRINPTDVDTLATSKGIAWFEQTCIDVVPFGRAGVGRRVYPGFRQLAGFIAMNLDRHAQAHSEMFDHLVRGDTAAAERHRRFYDEYLAVMDLPAEFYLETVREVFITHALPKGQLRYHGERVDLAAIERCALMAIEGELDDITGIGQTKAALDLTVNLPPSRKRYHFQEGAGHYGIFSGSRYRDVIVPALRRFTAESAVGQVPALAA